MERAFMSHGFFTDTTLCIGCKACEVACKQWNQLPADGYKLTNYSYDNTVALSSTTWRHVAFVEQTRPANGTGKQVNRLMMSDVCKHCTHAGCMEACPTGAIVRNEFGDVYVQPDICNGCGYCVPSCPFGVVGRNNDTGLAAKCTLCYDRQKDGLTPACAKACPTDSILFGDLDEMRARAEQRVHELHARGMDDAVLWDSRETSVGGTHALFIVRGDPRSYNLPLDAEVPTIHL